MARHTRLDRRALLGGGAATAALACATANTAQRATASGVAGEFPAARKGYPLLVGSANALAGMKQHYEALTAGAHPLTVAIDVVKVTEADPEDTSVGLGGLPNEVGAVALDAACMDGSTHNSGAVAAIENILHPSEVARLVMERTDHCLLVGRGAYEFARQHGHPHVELLTDASRRTWLEWKESMSDRDDRFPPADEESHGRAAGVPPELAEPEEELAVSDPRWHRPTGTIHCSALAVDGRVACTTTTSGLAFKIPGRVGDSPIVASGLYCDQEAGSAGSTGRGEAAILSSASSMIVELMRQGAAPVDAGLEVLHRIVRQTRRMAAWQPGLVREDGSPDFNINFYCLSIDGTWAGVSLRGARKFAVADPSGGPRHETCVPLFES